MGFTINVPVRREDAIARAEFHRASAANSLKIANEALNESLKMEVWTDADAKRIYALKRDITKLLRKVQ